MDLNTPRTTYQGTVKFVNLKSGFGFIRVTETGEEIYFSTKSLKIRLENDECVAFEIEQVKRGPKAVNIRKCPPAS